jgi:hypothetical protein
MADLRCLDEPQRLQNIARRPDGIFVAPFEQGEIGPDLFQAGCRMGLEGLVSKHKDRAYRAGIPVIPRRSSRCDRRSSRSQVFRRIPLGLAGNGSSKLPSPPRPAQRAPGPRHPLGSGSTETSNASPG